ncbi:DUF4304 domain-containing protein [Streptomyces sp. STR69]|uniref:DUF4304 domain-containing protein n=1 Tax=Streptomyces sp. STR69 TaxID=1796942 RepID=UPI0021C7EC2C|nr:DUF4304 domain-containing protein [Streptomyces sp. STR69]
MADRSAPTAQEAFTTLMRARIAPGLRALGFKGSGQTYELPHLESWALIGFQKSAHSTAGRVEFTLNVTVADKLGWARARRHQPHLPARPSPNTVYGPAAWHSRIGQLLPAKRDTWWTISATTDPGPVARGVITAVTEYALPAIREQRRS